MQQFDPIKSLHTRKKNIYQVDNIMVFNFVYKFNLTHVGIACTMYVSLHYSSPRERFFFILIIIIYHVIQEILFVPFLFVYLYSVCNELTIFAIQLNTMSRQPMTEARTFTSHSDSFACLHTLIN